MLTDYLQVQSGGSFDVDFVVTAPSGKIVTEGQKERQGDFVFTGNEIGDYSFCFDNEMSTVTDKFVDFEIAVRNSYTMTLLLAWVPSLASKHLC